MEKEYKPLIRAPGHQGPSINAYIEIQIINQKSLFIENDNIKFDKIVSLSTN